MIMMNGSTTLRLKARPWDLVRQTMGGPAVMADKLRCFVDAVANYGREDLVRARLERLRALGHIESIPSRIQRIVGALDMIRFFIVPAAADYYTEKGLDFRFHQLLRFLDDPASVIDPTGFNSTRDNIIGHVMQVVHANPEYDFQLLDTWEDGMAEMERQVEAVLRGEHPRAASILAIIEEPDYHARLLDHVKAYRRDPSAARLVRENVIKHFATEERTFGTVPSAMRYFSKMPNNLPAAVAHLMTVRRFPRHLAEPEPRAVAVA